MTRGPCSGARPSVFRPISSRARGAVYFVTAVALGSFFFGCMEGKNKDMPSPTTGNGPAQPAGEEATPWRGFLQVPGMQLFVLSDSAKRTRGAARIAGQSGMLRGKPAFDEARKRIGDSDPAALAALSMFFLEEDVAGQKPWTSIEVPDRVPEQQAIAAPPRLSDGVLEYWRFHAQLADMVRCRLTMSSGEVTCELGTAILRERELAQDPMAAVDKDLQANDIYLRMRAIDTLAQLDTDEAHQKLIELALDQKHYKVREAAVKALGKTGGKGVVAALSRVLLFDGHQKVRLAAAAALGALRDPGAREALEKAAKGDGNELVRAEAKRALQNL